MAHELLLVSNYMNLTGLTAQSILLALQWGTYRKTRHTSLRTIAVSTVLGLAVIVSSFAAQQYWISGHSPLGLYLVCAILLTLQMVIGILGVRSLLRAFEQALATRHVNE